MARDSRHIVEAVMLFLMRAATATIFIVLAVIIGVILYKGLPAMSWEMISKVPSANVSGEGGGVFNAIMGSLYLAGGATIFAFLLGVPITLFLNVYCGRTSRFAELTRFAFDVLWGVPSVVYGAFGFALLLWMGQKASLLAGIITVGVLVLPGMCRALDEAMQLVPRELKSVTFSLGATRFEVAFSVFFRQVIPGLITATLIAFGRAIGDAAAIIFTAGYTNAVPEKLTDQAATLSLTIFQQLSSPFPQVQNQAYASALILTAMILAVSITARICSRKFAKHVIK